MADNDQTILSGSGMSSVPQEPQQSKRNPLLIAGGIGCALLLCVGLLVGSAFYFAGDQLREMVAELVLTETPPAPPTPTEAATSAPVETATSAAAVEATSEAAEPAPPTESPTAMVAPSEPEIESITFALDATEEYEPIEPGDIFQEGVTEIHAIFEYSGFSPDSTWERVWYLDGEELLRSTEPWSGTEAGIFDYFINAGGEPLSPGEWLLELYVEDELLAEDSFVIEPAEASLAEATEEPMPTTEAVAAEAATPTVAASPTPRPPQARTYTLAYTKWDGGNHNIYVGDTNGSSEQLLVTRGAGPAWTPDGRYLFFYGEEAVDRQIRDGEEYINPNYSVSNGIVRVTTDPFPANVTQLDFFQGQGWNEGTARWANVAPNGQMVAYDAKPGGNYRIYFLGTEGNQQYRFEIDGEQADWAPDSERLVYRSGRGGRTGIWISNRDDSGHIMVTENGSDSFPAWSPDGQTIAFSRDQDGNVDIYTMNVDGTNVQRLTEAPGPDTLPTFTPDGQIIFRSARSGSWAIWKMSRSGATQTEIVADAPVGPDWAYSRMSVLP